MDGKPTPDSRAGSIRLLTVPFLLALAVGLAVGSSAPVPAQDAKPQAEPPSNAQIFPLSQVHAGLRATAWTVFAGARPEPMDVEILGVLRGGRGPGQDMILVQLHGAKPEYTGVVAGMSGSPVYVEGKLMGALSYRIGQFAKDPIAGITPIEQMLAVRDLPMTNMTPMTPGAATDGMNLQPMETPLTMSGFSAEAVRFWRRQMAGTGLETVAAGGAASSSASSQPSIPVAPGAAVSALLVQGDMEIAATCTVTYLDAKQLLACGHPLFQAGTISLPMTSTEIVATLASPMNAFKIVNTGVTIGAFTEDRDAAIRGQLGAKARMIPMQVAVEGEGGSSHTLHVEVLDEPGLTPQAAEVVLLQALVQSIGNTATASYHVTGSIDVVGMEPFPVDLWAVPSETMPAPIAAVLQLGDRLGRIYTNNTRRSRLRGIDLQVETLARHAQSELTAARLLGSNVVHAGDTVQLEVSLQPWQQPERKVQLSFRLPTRLGAGNLRLLVSDAATLDRATEPLQVPGREISLESLRAVFRQRRPADRVYVSLLEPEAQAGVGGQTLASLPLSAANALEGLRLNQLAGLNGESAEVVADGTAGELVTGFTVLNLRIEPGAGLN